MGRSATSPLTVPPLSSSRLSADRPRSPVVTRRRLQVALGVLWLMDGLLQVQPFMFTRGFSQQVLAPAATGQPQIVAGSVTWAAHLVAQHPLQSNTLFVLGQLALGLGFLFRRTARWAIVASVAWAGGVWLLGEGLGGVLGGSATLLTGAPGAVALYAVIGLAAWPRPGRGAEGSGGPPARWLTGAWAVLWGLYTVLGARAWSRTGDSLVSQIAGSAGGAPAWLAHIDRFAGRWAMSGGTALVVVVLVTQAAVGLLALRPGRSREVAVGIGIAAAFVAWAVGQSFGQLASGMATDPNSGPLVILMGVAVLGVGPPRASRGSGTPPATRAKGWDEHGHLIRSAPGSEHSSQPLATHRGALPR